ncbi:MAG: aldo/keto reductase [Verrucomicrobiota bacterium]
MKYRRLGGSGLQVSVLSYGAWVTFSDHIGEKEAAKCMRTAYDAGVNFFDNAEGYAGGKAEVMMGSIFKKMGWPRDTWLVSSKVFFGAERKGPNQTGLSRKHVFEACDAALQRLQVDYLDLYFCHRPDPDTPVEETVRAMNDLIRLGKVLYWGTSEWEPKQLQAAYDVADRLGLIGPQMEQPQYHLFHRENVEKKLDPFVKKRGLGTTTWSPLGAGLLTGKYRHGVPKDSRGALPKYEWLRERFVDDDAKAKLPRLEKLGALADKLDMKLPQLALAWCIQCPNVSTVITGASKASQVEENMQAVELTDRLTANVMAKIDRILAEK